MYLGCWRKLITVHTLGRDDILPVMLHPFKTGFSPFTYISDKAGVEYIIMKFTLKTFSVLVSADLPPQ